MSDASVETIELWPGGVPGALGNTAADRPSLTVYLPPAGTATGAGAVVCPGGGYANLALDHEGVQVAEWLNHRGAAAFLLRYRTAPYRHPAPLLDAQRAIRTVRTRVRDFDLDADRIGIWGFSAGGHLASTVATHFDAGNPLAADPIDRAGSRPDFLILCYPVISMRAPYAHIGSRNNLLGPDPDAELLASLSNETQVTSETPPAFLFHTDADSGVPSENSVMFYLALRAVGVPAELHIYEHGPHGVGLATGDPVLSTWSDRLADWLKAR